MRPLRARRTPGYGDGRSVTDAAGVRQLKLVPHWVSTSPPWNLSTDQPSEAVPAELEPFVGAGTGILQRLEASRIDRIPTGNTLRPVAAKHPRRASSLIHSTAAIGEQAGQFPGIRRQAWIETAAREYPLPRGWRFHAEGLNGDGLRQWTQWVVGFKLDWNDPVKELVTFEAGAQT